MPQQTIGDLLNAEMFEKKARAIEYYMPLAKELEEFNF